MRSCFAQICSISDSGFIFMRNMVLLNWKHIEKKEKKGKSFKLETWDKTWRAKYCSTTISKNHHNKEKGSGALSRKMLLVRNIENDKINAYFRSYWVK